MTNILRVKAAQTKARLQKVGLELIAEAGYEAVTVEQIARAAGVSHMTFFRHFPTKQSVVLHDPFDPTIAAAVAAQPPNSPALARACRGVRVALESVDLPAEEQVRIRVRIAAVTPALRAGMWANTLATQTAIGDALSERSPLFESRVAAAATIGALTVAVVEWATAQEDGSLKHRLLEALGVLDPLSQPAVPR